MKKVLIIHGWESNSKEHWYQEEKGLLEKMGFQVSVPDMPNTNFPKLAEWVKVIEEFKPDEESVLIGHSLGAPTILRYLEKADNKVDKVILIAGFAQDLGYEETRNFVDRPFDWSKIKESVNEIYVLNQKEDPWVPLERGKVIADALGVELTVVEGNNHFDTFELDLVNRNI